jgi:hypothetical protein
MMAPPARCVAFAVMRFAPAGELPATLAAWREWYGLDGDDVLAWMAHIELEKTLRIVRRIAATGHYRHLLGNVAARHLRSLHAVRLLRAG